MNKNFFRKKWKLIVDSLISIIVIATLIWMFVDFDRFLQPDFMPTGKAAKLMIVITNFLHEIGGKFFTVMIFSVLAVPFVYRTIRGLLKDEPTINDDNRNIILAAGNMFIYNGNN